MKGEKEMRKSIALKQLLRAPLKTLLTFLLIAAASFTLFSRVADYAVTTRERENAMGYYKGVAALDNTTPETVLEFEDFSYIIDGEKKPWPTDEQLQEFSSLPGVTLAETRYMTAGLIEGCKRIFGKEELDEGTFVMEGGYAGYEEASEGKVYLIFDNVKPLTGNMEFEPKEPIRVLCPSSEYYLGKKNPYPKTYWDSLKKGSRCLVVGILDNILGISGFAMEYVTQAQGQEDLFRVVEGLPEHYLETEEFTFYKELIEVVEQAADVYDIVYTSDMNSIPYVNERSMVISQGRPLTAKDPAGCVVNEQFLEENGMSVGDTIRIQLGDRLFNQSYSMGAQPYNAESMSKFTDTVELEIIGAYQFNKRYTERISDRLWNYSESTVFVPASLLPVEVPADHQVEVSEFSVFIENAKDIESFLRESEPLVTEMGINMRFSDRGWMNVKDGLETGARISLLTTALYLVGTALALFLAVFLYIGRSKKPYAIMRMLGTPGKAARNAILLPFAVLCMIAMTLGGMIGLSYAQGTAAVAIEEMVELVPDEFVPNARISASTVLLCLVLELGFTALLTLFFLRRMKRIPPLELLSGNLVHTRAWKRKGQDAAPPSSIPVKPELSKLPIGVAKPSRRRYGSVRQVSAYVMRHMRRGLTRTAVTFALAVVLTAGVGTLVLARLTFRDIFHEVDVKGALRGFSSSTMQELSQSPLVQDFYYQTSYRVRINGVDASTKMVFTNNVDQYASDFTEDYKIQYAEGFDASSMEGMGPLCILGNETAELYGVKPGDSIGLLSDVMYFGLAEIEMFQEDEKRLKEARENATKQYKVIGVIESKDMDIATGIFGAINDIAESMYSNPFIVESSEFILADNTRYEELNDFLARVKAHDYGFGMTSSYYLDAEEMKNMDRICRMLEELFPIAVAAAVLLGIFGPGLVILQSAKEAAFLRVLGVTKKRTRCMLAFEQIILCVIGTLLVIAALAIYNPGRFLRASETLAFCSSLYLLGSICGILLASLLVTRHKVLELLHIKE